MEINNYIDNNEQIKVEEKDESTPPIPSYDPRTNEKDVEARHELGMANVKIGWEKGKDMAIELMNRFNPDVDYVTKDGKIFEVAKKDSEQVKQSEIRKEDIRSAMEEREAIYLAHPNELNKVDEFASGIIETIANPVTSIFQASLGIATGGMSLVPSLALQATADIAQLKYETNRYEERDPSLNEYGMTVASSVLPDLGFHYAGKYVNNLSRNLGDSIGKGVDTVNVRNEIKAFDEFGKYKGSVDKEVFSKNSDKLNINDPILKNGDPFEVDYEKLDNEIMNSDLYSINELLDDISTNEVIDELNKKNITPYKQSENDSFIQVLKKSVETNEDANIDVWIDSIDDGINEDLLEGKNTTVFQRYTTKNDYILDAFNIKDNNDILGLKSGKKIIIEAGTTLPNGRILPESITIDPNKTSFQNYTAINRKISPIAQDIVEGIKPTIDLYKEMSFKGGVGYKPSVQYDNINRTLQKINGNYELQKANCQFEYENKFGMNKDALIKKVSSNKILRDDTDLAKQWVTGEFSNEGKFEGLAEGFNQVREDSIKIVENKMKFELYSLEDYDNFKNKYGKAFDTDEDIIFDENYINEITRTYNKGNTVDELDKLLEAGQSNMPKYIDYFTDLSNILDRIEAHNGDISKLNLSTEDTKFFNKFSKAKIINMVSKNKDLIRNEMASFEKVAKKPVNVSEISVVTAKEWDKKLDLKTKKINTDNKLKVDKYKDTYSEKLNELKSNLDKFKEVKNSILDDKKLKILEISNKIKDLDNLKKEELSKLTDKKEISKFNKDWKKEKAILNKDKKLIISENKLKISENKVNIDKYNNAMKDLKKEKANYLGNNKKELEQALLKAKDTNDNEMAEYLTNMESSKDANKDWRRNVEVHGDWKKAVEDWKLGVARKIAKAKKAKSEISIKLNDVVNKQKLTKEYYSYFDEPITETNATTVRFKDEKTRQKVIDTLYGDGKLTPPEDISYDQHFAEFINALNKTRQSANITDDYRSVGSLSEYFDNDTNRLVDFFIDQPHVLKDNAQIINDIFDRQTGDISKIMSYGTISPYSIINNVNRKIDIMATNILSKNLNQAEKQILNTTKVRYRQMIENTLMYGGAKESDTLVGKGSKVARKALLNRYLGFGGLSEFGISNTILSLYRTQQYGGGFATYSNVAQMTILKMIRNTKGLKPSGITDFVLANSNKAMDLSGDLYNRGLVKAKNVKKSKGVAHKVDTGLDLINHLTMSINELSDVQFRKFGDSFTTAQIYKLPKKFENIQNEMKDLLRINNINESNYEAFTKYAKDHIDNNELTVNHSQLSDIYNATGNEMAESLRGVSYQLAQHVGNIKGNSIFQNKFKSEITAWGSMWRGFTRSFNENVKDRVLFYTDNSGASRPRFNTVQYVKDRKLKGIASDSLSSMTGTIALILAGGSQLALKEFIYSSKDLDERVAIIKTRADRYVKMLNGTSEKETSEIIQTLVNDAGVDPLENLSPTDISNSLKKKAKSVTGKLLNEADKDNAMGERISGLLELTSFIVVPKKFESVYGGLTDESEYDGFKKPYDFSKQEGMEAESRLNNAREKKYRELKMKIDYLKETPIEEIHKQLDDLSSNLQVSSDYLEEDTRSYDGIKDSRKVVFEEAMKLANIKDSDKDSMRSEIALYSNGVNFENENDMDEFIGVLKDELGLDLEEAFDKIYN